MTGFRRQFSSQMSTKYDAADDEFAAALAAAAYAVFSLENRTRKNDTVLSSDRLLSRRFSNKDVKIAGETSMRKLPGGNRNASTDNYVVSSKRPSHSSSIKPSSRNNSTDTKANAWEKSQMEKIKKWSNKMKSSILSWENEKKMRSKLKFDKEKRDLELRRERNMQHYNMKIANIDKIGEEARAQVEAKRKHQESTVTDKAKLIRSSGKTPVTCFCC